MSPNTTIPLAFPSPQTNSTTTDNILTTVYGTAGIAISAFTIYHSHRMWKLWRLNDNRVHDEEHELGSISTTANESSVNNAPPTHGSPAPSEPSAPSPSGGKMSDVEQDVCENEDVQS